MILVMFFNRKANLKTSFIKSFITKPSGNDCFCHVPVMCWMRSLTLSMLSFGFPFKHRKFEGINLSFGWIIFLLFMLSGLLHRQALVFPCKYCQLQRNYS